MDSKIPVLVIAGPTATGKSQLALELAAKFNGEIISADSMQVYKYMDIGTAKVDRIAQTLVPHHLLDVVEPDQEFSLAQYKLLADIAIDDINRRGRLPLIVGGTGLYIKAVIDNYPLSKLPYDPNCRTRLNRDWDEKGRDFMIKRLSQVDPSSALKVLDRRRIIRALEVYELTGQSQSAIQELAKEESRYRALIFALSLPRQELYDRINKRTEAMVIQGLVEEYTYLIEKGYSPRAKAMEGLGYYHAGMYVSGKWSQQEMITFLQRDTRRYAKRQFSWFRGMDKVSWLDNSNLKESILNISTAVAGKLLHVSE